MTYSEALEYIHSITWRGSRPGLSRTKELLAKIGNPEKSFKAVHITGTNGKGSTASFTESILRAAGYKTGLYTSPYISVFNERIQCGGKMISDSELAEITEYVRPFAETMEDPPTEFELITAIGFEYFKRCGCEIAVIEAGMGGLLDSTNVIPAPLVAVITAIGLDHTKELGSDFATIAETKAGIIKEGSRVVFYGENEAAELKIKEKSNQIGCNIVIPDFSKINVIKSDISGSIFDYYGHNGMHIGLIGDYQVKNAAMAIHIADELTKCNIKISEAHLKEGLSAARWPGRFEVLAHAPIFISDGAHNPHGMSAAVNNIKMLFGDKKVAVVMGVMADKSYDEMLDMLACVTDKIYSISPENPRALNADELAIAANRHGIKASSFESIKGAVSTAVCEQGADGVVFALGSLYMYSEISDCVKCLYKLE